MDNWRDKITEWTKFRRDFSEGIEKEGEEKNSSSKKREKLFDNSREVFGVFWSVEWELYL